MLFRSIGSELTMRKLRSLVAAGLLGLVPVVHAYDIIGEATAPDTGDFLYREGHRCTSDGTSCLVSYYDREGNSFASKRIDYTRSLTAPNLEFKDTRLDVRVVVDEKATTDIVIDAGFDNYVRENWTVLAAGDELRFRFLAAGRPSPLRMSARRDLRQNCPDTQLCLNIALDSLLFGFFVDPIKLAYDRSTRRLLRYRGLSDIKDVSGAALDVDIVYTYNEFSRTDQISLETRPATPARF